MTLRNELTVDAAYAIVIPLFNNLVIYLSDMILKTIMLFSNLVTLCLEENKQTVSFFSLGEATRSHHPTNGSRQRPREDGAGSRGDARGPRQEPKPRDDGSRWSRKPHGRRPQAQNARYFRNHAGRKGRANASFCGV